MNSIDFEGAASWCCRTEEPSVRWVCCSKCEGIDSHGIGHDHAGGICHSVIQRPISDQTNSEARVHDERCASSAERIAAKGYFFAIIDAVFIRIRVRRFCCCEEFVTVR